MMCGQFNHSIGKFREDSDLAVLREYKVTWREDYLSSFGVAFGRGRTKWNIEFDQFFIAHYSPSLLPANQTLLQRVAVRLIEALMVVSDQQRANDYLQKWREQKEEKEKA